MTTAAAPHSHEWIDDSRYEWWNRDFLELLRHRIGLKSDARVLDVGVGAGHWSGLLLDVPEARFDLTGVDFEEHWLAQAALTFSKHPGIASFTPVQGNAEKLPLPDDSFDVVTCQTVLMHCGSPALAISEFMRVLKPEGWIVAVEPVNTLNRISFSDCLTLAGPVHTARLTLTWCYLEEGRRLATGNDHNIGAKLLSMFELAGLSHCKSFQNDCLSPNTYPVSGGFDQSLRDLDNPEYVAFIRQAGATDADLENARRALDVLSQTAITYTGQIVNPSPVIITIGRKAINA